jgi:hypothetical protein
MHEEVKAALREAIKTAGEQLQPLVGQFKEPHLVWSKHGEQWKGEYRQEPSLLTIFAEARPALETLLVSVLFSTKKELTPIILRRRSAGVWAT